MPAIETEELSKDFHIGFWRPKPYRALDRLTMSVEEGEVFGFLGPNGAGKSTTLKLLMGLIFPTSGVARIFGKAVGDLDTRRRYGFLPENPSFYDYLTAEELLTYFASLHGLRGEERKRRVAHVLDEVKIGSERRLKLRSYSKGMIQRVGVAQALLNEPSLVFLDEPMSGLDPLGRRDLRQLMLRLRDRGATIFFSSHILSDAEALCSRVGIVAQGKLVAQGRLADIVAFETRGWELVVANLSEQVRTSLAPRVQSITTLSSDRFTVELSPKDSPEKIIQELTAQGVQVLSLNPIRSTLEDYFVSTVGTATPRDTTFLRER
jgi:ABC-2 type transport system ATP-binding protein